MAFTLADPYGSPQVLSSYAYSSHGQGAPKAAVHRGDGSVICGEPDAWHCQHRWPEISGMVSPMPEALHQEAVEWRKLTAKVGQQCTLQEGAPGNGKYCNEHCTCLPSV